MERKMMRALAGKGNFQEEAIRHPDRSAAKWRDPGEVTFKLAPRDSSASLGMTSNDFH
jgi:hypothetical protein